MTSLPGLWFHLDLSDATGPVRITAVNTYLKYAHYMVKSASLVGLSLQNSKNLQNIVERCRHLVQLDINGSGLLSESLLSAIEPDKLQVISLGRQIAITEDTMRRLLEKLPGIAEVKFGNVALSGHPRVPWPIQFPNLRILEITITDHPLMRTGSTFDLGAVSGVCSKSAIVSLT